MSNYFRKKIKGFSMIEALLAGSLLALVVFILSGILIFGQESSRIAGDSQRATSLAEEGLEAARNMSEASFSNLSAGPHGLVVSGGKWQFSGTEDYTEVFTRSLMISDLDSYTKAVTSTVHWSANAQREGSISLSGRFTNWRRAGQLAIGNWASTTVEATYASTTNAAYGEKVLVDGNYAYVGLVSGVNNFIIFDISNPAAPVRVGLTSVTASITDMAISGNHVYISSSGDSNELIVVDVTNKTAPVIDGVGYNAAGNGDGSSVDVVGNRVYLGRLYSNTPGQGEFYILDCTDPTHLSVLNTAAGFNLTANVNDIEVSSNSYAYLATAVSTAELTVLNVSSSTNPLASGVRNITGTVIGSAVTIYDSNADGIEDVAILALNTTGVIWPINVSIPSSPTLILASGYQTTAGNVLINDLEPFNSNKYLALATASSAAEVIIVNMTTSTSFSILGKLNLSGVTNITAYSVAYAAGVDRLLVSTLRASSNYILQIIKPN